MPHVTAADGVELYYEETGSGTPIVFVHEFGGDYRAWEPQLRYFARTHRCITFNARGYPPSAVPDDPEMYSQDLARDDVLAVLDGLCVLLLFGNGFPIPYGRNRCILAIGNPSTAAGPQQDQRDQDHQKTALAFGLSFAYFGSAGSISIGCNGPKSDFIAFCHGCKLKKISTRRLRARPTAEALVSIG